MSEGVQVSSHSVDEHTFSIRIAGELTKNDEAAMLGARPWVHGHGEGQAAGFIEGARFGADHGAPSGQGAGGSGGSGGSGAQVILFDMRDLSYCNSAGIALLIRFVREAQQQGYQVGAYGVSAHYQKIFRIVGLTLYMELFPDEYGAIETFKTRRSFEG